MITACADNQAQDQGGEGNMATQGAEKTAVESQSRKRNVEKPTPCPWVKKKRARDKSTKGHNSQIRL